jgi:hypothetical protein
VLDEIPPLTDTEPVEGSRDGWSYSTYRRIGLAVADKPDGSALHYGVYGVRSGGCEVLLQAEGGVQADGVLYGTAVVASSTDSGAYFWYPVGGLSSVSLSADVRRTP